MRQTKFRFSSPTDDGFTGNMGKTLSEALSAPNRDVSLATFDLVSYKHGDDLRSKSEQEQTGLHQAPPVQFVDDDGQVCPLPMFVTRTTLSTLLADDQDDDVGAAHAEDFSR